MQRRIAVLAALARRRGAVAVPAFAATDDRSRRTTSVRLDVAVTSSGHDACAFVWTGELPAQRRRSRSGPTKFHSQASQTDAARSRRTLTTQGTYTIVCTIHPEHEDEAQRV